MRFQDGIGLNEDFTMWSHGNEENCIRLTNGDPRGLRTKIVVRDHETGAIVFVGHNKTMLPASEFMAMHMFKLPVSSFLTPTYNTRAQLEENQIGTSNDIGDQYKVQLFCMGTSGCGRGSLIKYEVSNKKWIAPEDLAPFQYVPKTKDLNTTERGIYFGRKNYDTQGFWGYLFKKFDSNPVIKKVLEDGTPWGGSIYSDSSELEAQVIVTTSFSVSKSDGRDYFIETTGINDGRFNCIELCFAWPRVVGGYTYYQDIRPATRLNFPNKVFSDLGASWDFSYSIYF